MYLLTCIIIIHFHPLLLLLMLRNATNILRMVRILATSVDGTVRSVTQQEVRSRAKDFLPPPLLLTLSSSCCLFLAKVQEAHIHKLCRPLLPHPSCNHI